MPQTRTQSIACTHRGVHRVGYDEFECHDCRMLFVGVDSGHPQFSAMIDAIRLIGRGTGNVYTQTGNQNYLGSMPEDVNSIKAKMDELEKTLLVFAEILKDALRT